MTQTATVRSGLLTTALLGLTFVPGVLAFGPVFSGAQGWLAAGGGVLLGLTIGFVAAWRRWALASTTAVVVAAYLLFGGALALPRTTLFGVVPTLDTLVRLVPLSFQSWRDLLTVTPPADDFIGPAVVPFLAGLVLAVLATAWCLRATAYLWALLPPLLLLTIAILWGLGDAPWAPWLGVGFGVAALALAVFLGAQERSRTADDLLEGAQPLAGRGGRVARAGAVMAIGGLVAVAAAPVLGVGVTRQVLRDQVHPPLRVHDMASPLMQYRWFELDMKDVTLFTVSGLPAGARLRLATLDAYDGVVYNVADASAGFVRIGEKLARSGDGEPVSLDVEVGAYTGLWVPGGGEVSGARFTGERRDAQAEGLHYNAWGGTLLTTAGLREGDTYSVDVRVPSTTREDAATRSIAQVPVPANERVPDVVGSTALEIAGDAASPLQQLERLELRLREGYYSNGADGTSRSGHTAERIASMLTAPALIGDDEQYAVAMALMARQLGIPARVVLGFYPDAAQGGAATLPVTGDMAHVWVEVPFEGAGWVVFDPTPDRNRLPQTEVPQPKPQPKPQVITLPEPPPNLAPDPFDDPGAERETEDEDGNELLMEILRTAGLVAGGVALVSGPFVAIGTLKRARRQRRRNASDLAARSAGGWAEVEDLATDLGVGIPSTATRLETAVVLAEAYPQAATVPLAMSVDAAVFAPGSPVQGQADHVWQGTDAVLAAMRAETRLWRRIGAFCSLRSFARGKSLPTADALLRRLPRPARKEVA